MKWCARAMASPRISVDRIVTSAVEFLALGLSLRSGSTLDVFCDGLDMPITWA